jgi:hypothetical protein
MLNRQGGKTQRCKDAKMQTKERLSKVVSLYGFFGVAKKLLFRLLSCWLV